MTKEEFEKENDRLSTLCVNREAVIGDLKEKLAVAVEAICRLLDLEDSEDVWEDTEFAKHALIKIRGAK